MLSMKFPHLFLRPEIIITFLRGWEWSGGQVRHRSPRNSGFFSDLDSLSKLIHLLESSKLEFVGFVLEVIHTF